MLNKKSIIFLSISIFLFSSCQSDNVNEYVSVDYGNSDAVLREVSNIEALLESDCVKALWKSCLLIDNSDDNEEFYNLKTACAECVIAEYKKAVTKRDFIEAKRLYDSLKNCDPAYVADFEYDDVKLSLFISESIEALKSSDKTVSRDKVSTYVKGTVTVYVDKGIKVYHGQGVADVVLGSGFFISKDGHIVTNYHVISDCVDSTYEGYTRLYVKLADDTETKIPARVIGYDSVLDMALLKVEVDAPYVFKLGSSLDLDTGDKVYAIGSPLGFDRTLTSGIISATDRELLSLGKVFQVDAAVNSGNSGGPLIDESGRVQAIVFAGMLNYEGLNFAIPIEYLKYELPFLYQGGKREHAWIGCYGKTKRVAGSGVKNEGVTVHYILPGGSVSNTGIIVGNTILEINGKSISSIDDLQNYFLTLSPKTIINIKTMESDGRETSSLVYVDQRPDNPGYEAYRRDLPGNFLYPVLGMELVPISENRKKYTVSKIIKGSTADEYNFSEGDPVDIIGIDFSDNKSYSYIRLSVNKKKNAYFNYTIGLQVQMNNLYYF